MSDSAIGSLAAAAFRERARLEAARYGPDPWVFVRELLQNSRDAGATRVRFEIESSETREVVRCLDDGEGMSFEHARRYLFSLYASSKGEASNQVGKFGVGFWSILRFDPVSISIRSRPAVGEGWGVRLDGQLEHAEVLEPLERAGTEITLERARGDGRLEHRVYDAVWQNARFLYSRDEAESPLTVLVNGKVANAPFTLAAPSASFSFRGARGVVGLGRAPQVELFSRGLRVRSAASLEDLVSPNGRYTTNARVRFPSLPGGLAPCALLESSELQVLLSRSDARDTRQLQRLVRTAQRELKRLVTHQLTHVRPLPWWRRWIEACMEELRESILVRVLVGGLVGATAAIALVGYLVSGSPSTASVARGVAVAEVPDRPAVMGYQDLSSRYAGPQVDTLVDDAGDPPVLRYEPATEQLYFAGLRFMRLSAGGDPVSTSGPRRPHPGIRCGRDCIDVTLDVHSKGGVLRLPVPTGYAIVRASLKGEPLQLWVDPDGQPFVELTTPVAGPLVYQVGASRDVEKLRFQPTAVLPVDLSSRARRLRREPLRERVDRLIDLVRQRVRYDRSESIARAHTTAAERGEGLIARTLAIGAGDCDLQNSVLLAALQMAKVPSRLAVGYVGIGGETRPSLHAWVEYRDGLGTWRVADASEGGALAPSSSDVSDEGSLPEVRSTGARSEAAAVEPSPVAIDAIQGDESADASQFSMGLQWLWLLSSTPLVLLVAGGWSAFRNGSRRSLNLDRDADIASLIEGVLQQPSAFGHMTVVFNRPLVPRIDGSMTSLSTSRSLAAKGRLYRAEGRTKLAAQAAKSGAVVLDARTAEGRAVADALGAIDLDRWAELLARSFCDATIDRINATLVTEGEDWSLRLVRGTNVSFSVLDLAPLGTRIKQAGAVRVVLLSETDPTVARVRSMAATDPGAAALLITEYALRRLGLPRSRGVGLLAELGRRAVVGKARR